MVYMLLFAAIKLVLHLATSQGYGYFRDELYYIACSEHLDYGYVDHPAFSIVVLWFSRALLGDSLLAIRLIPALAGAGTIVLVGLIARELGGGRFAQIMAMTAALIAPAYLSANQYYSMNALDILLWAAAAYVLIRIVNDGTSRDWWLLGAVLAVGLANKISVLWLGAGLTVGLLITAERRWLRTPWPWVAAAIAMAGLAPYVAWQLTHDWATLEFIRNATTEKMVEVAVFDFVRGQVEMMHPINLPLWLAGLAFFLGTERGRPWRLLGWIYVTVLAILVVAGSSRSGYLAPAYTWLLPAGSVLFETWCRRPRIRGALVSVWLVAGAALVPFTLPVLPIPTYIAYAKALGQEPTTEERKDLSELPQHYADMHGWEHIVATVADVAEGLPADTGVLAPDYGIAGAIDVFGPRYGLRRASSGHNNYWFWGPHLSEDVTIVVGGSRNALERRFEHVELAREALDCGYCMPYEDRRSVWVCRGMKMPIATFWEGVRHYD